METEAAHAGVRVREYELVGCAPAQAIPASLRLVDSSVSTTGVHIGTYEPAGELVTGTFGAY